MINEKISSLKKTNLADPRYCYILVTAAITFLYMSFHKCAQVFYEYGLIIPCMLFLGIQQERKKNLADKKIFLLPGAMVLWFLFLQAKRSIEGADVDNIGLFLSVYLFAFPLASLLQDGDKKNALKLFAGAYLSAATVISVNALLLVLDYLPKFLDKYVFWNGGRLEVFWHANIAACYIMIGIVFCTTYLSHLKSIWSKTALAALLLLMVGTLALTNCRTAIILTGVYFGSTLFFMMVQRGRTWFFPGVLVVLVVTAVFYGSAIRLYQANYDVLIKKYSQQYSAQIASNSSNSSTAEELPSAETTETEKISFSTETETEIPNSAQETVTAPESGSDDGYYEEDYYAEKISAKETPIEVDPDTGEMSLITNSPQGSLASDFATLNSRTIIWSAAGFAIRETPSILYWGMHDPGWYVSFYSDIPIGHMHNAWLQCLVGTGLIGFLIAMLFTLITIWNCLIVLLKHHQDIWKRNIALLSLCLLVAAVLEPYLFYTSVNYHLIDFAFFLCSGYLVHWQEEDNQQILNVIRKRIPFLKK